MTIVTGASFLSKGTSKLTDLRLKAISENPGSKNLADFDAEAADEWCGEEGQD